MKRITIVLALVLTLVLLAVTTWAGGVGPAPNSGDGASDGSGIDSPEGPINDGVGDPFGPAPNAGDGIPDGSGMIPPNDPAL